MRGKPSRAKGRPHRRKAKSELWTHLENRDLLPDLSSSYCALRLTWSTAVVLEVLLRCGLANEPRVVRAINTLMALRGRGGWCGCGYLDARVEVQTSQEAVDLNRVGVSQENVPHLIDWFAGREDIAAWICDDHRQALAVAPDRALLANRFHTTGDCSLVMHRALSFHPQCPVSRLERIAPLECAFRQSAHGEWGDAYLSAMFETIRRFRQPLAAFLAIRSVPLLIRTQRSGGVWEEPQPHEGWADMRGPCRALSTLRICRALEEFGYLQALRPQG